MDPMVGIASPGGSPREDPTPGRSPHHPLSVSPPRGGPTRPPSRPHRPPGALSAAFRSVPTRGAEPPPPVRSPSAPGSMRRGPPGSASPDPEPRNGRALGSPGGARAARRLRRRGGTPRLLPDVRNIFASPREAAERGRGHRFVPRAPHRGWCDLCGAAVRERALRCDCECCRPAILPRTASRTLPSDTAL